MFKTLYAGQWPSLKSFPTAPLTHPAFAALVFLLHPAICPSTGLLYLLFILPGTLPSDSPTVCSLDLFQVSVQIHPPQSPPLLNDIKRARNESNQTYHFFFLHLPAGTYICLLPAPLYHNVSFMTDSQ